MHPSILGANGKFTVLRDIVGRRPTRKGGLRLEMEKPRRTGTGTGGDMMGEGESGGVVVVVVVHAYGADGSGFALSWGVAAKVAEMVEKARLELSSYRAVL